MDRDYYIYVMTSKTGTLCIGVPNNCEWRAL